VVIIVNNNCSKYNLYKYFLFLIKILFLKKHNNKICYLNYRSKKEKSLLSRNKLTYYFGKDISILFYCKNKFSFFSSFIKNNFKVGYNVLFIDYNYNYNYIPVTNKVLFSRSLKDLYKYIKLFNVNVVLLLDVSKKKFIFRKLSKFNLIYISTNLSLDNSNLDLNLGFNYSPYINYILYICVINEYIATQNCKNLI